MNYHYEDLLTIAHSQLALEETGSGGQNQISKKSEQRLYRFCDTDRCVLKCGVNLFWQSAQWIIEQIASGTYDLYRTLQPICPVELPGIS